MFSGKLSSAFLVEGWRNSPILVNVYNPGAKDTFVVRLKVPKVEMQAYYLNEKVATDIICADDENPTECDLFFLAELTGMQMHTFYLKVENN